DAVGGLADELPLLRLVEEELVHPAVAVGAGLVTLVADRLGDLRRPLQGDGGGGEGGGDAVPAQQLVDARPAFQDAVLVVRLVGVGGQRLVVGYAQVVGRLGAAVTGEDGALRALIDVDDDGEGQAGIVRPNGSAGHQ